MKISNNLLWFLLSFVLRVAKGQLYSDMDGLLRHFFNESRYNKLLRPLYNQSQAVEVNFTQNLVSIEAFDIVSGELYLTEYFHISWTDELLTWSPTVYLGKERIPLPKGLFWKPEIVLRGGADDLSSITENDFSPAWVNYQGSVLMIPACNFKVRCNIDTTYYPFDKHECSFFFIVSNHNSSELILNSPTKTLDTSTLEEHGEWKVENFTETIVFGKDKNIERLTIPMVHTSFIVKRRPLSPFFNIIVPSQFLCILNIVTCCVRPDSGERLSFAVTLYLAFVFSTTSLIERIPNNSLKMPVISYFILSVNVMNAVCVTWSIFVVHLAKIVIIRRKLPRALAKMVMKRRQESTSKITNRVKPVIGTKQTTDVHSITGIILNRVKVNHDINYDHLNKISGLELSFVLDRIFFWCLIVILVVLFILFFVFVMSKVI